MKNGEERGFTAAEFKVAQTDGWEKQYQYKVGKKKVYMAPSVPAIAEGLEKLRSRVLIFCYQLSHIRNGKSHIQKSLAVWKPEMERYAGLVQQIKEKSKERKSLVSEKKELPVYRVMRHKALAVRITELTEDLEELRSEKSLLLQKFEYAEDAGAEAFRKDIATMEAGLKKLEAQEKAAERQLKDSNSMQEKPSLVMLLSAKHETSRLLGEDAEERQARQMIMRRRSTEQLKRSHLKTDQFKIER